MLELAAIFLASLLLSTVAIWLYRAVSGWLGFRQTTVAHRSTAVGVKLEAQYGFISLKSPVRQEARKMWQHSPKDSLKIPWGW